MKEELMQTQSCHLILSKNDESVPASKMSFPTAEQFKQNKVLLGLILKW